MIETCYKVSNKKFKGENVILETTDKKAADAHDKMLDRAEGIFDNLANAVKNKEIKCKLDENQIEEVSIHLSRNSLEYSKLLKSVKKK